MRGLQVVMDQPFVRRIAPDVSFSRFINESLEVQRDSAMYNAVITPLNDDLKSSSLVCPGILCDYPSVASLGITSQCQDFTSVSVTNCS
jgi:hypothetical protein